MSLFQKSKPDAVYPTITLPQLFVAAAGVVLAVTVSQLPNWFYDIELFGPRADQKPFRTFTDFYPFYLSEHSDMNNRLLHLFGTTLSMIVMVLNPMLIQAMLAACSVGYMLCSVFSGLTTGLYEGVAMLVVLLGLSRLSNDHRAACAILLIGYSFAWVGHFVYEGNRPATFIYPAYSLIGDFRMWFDAVMGNIPGIWK